ncbi:MAG: hypothetical protein ABR577_14890 [Pyrinomonadaceae bacterium]
MKLSHAGTLSLILAAILSASGCSAVNNIRAKSQLNDGARAYGAGHFAEAQQHFEQALELNPEQKNAPFFIARSIHAQFKPGVDTPENMAKATGAIDAYQKVLQQDPNNEEAYKAVASLYGTLKEEKKQRDWIMARATQESASPDKRSDAYTYIASQDATCSNTITELPANKPIVQKDGKPTVQYRKPQDPKDFEKAMQCTTEGMEFIEKAISLDPNNETAWSAKTTLLLELSKLAEMQGDANKKAAYSKQADAARQETARLNKLNQEKEEEAAKKSPSPTS